MRREELPELVRHVDLLGESSSVLYSRLSALTADAAIAAQVAYFGSLRHDFEWKVYGHDQPADLSARLAAHGFSIGETETLLVLDLETTVQTTDVPTRVRKITRAELHDVATVQHRVYPARNTDARMLRLAYELERTPDGISVYVAYVDGVPASCAWIRFPRSSAFASVWGGATAPDFRKRGLYTELLGVRLNEARDRGFGYVTIDARDTSRPIVEKYGFQVLTFTTPCMWLAERG